MAAIAIGILGAAPTLIQGVASLVHGIENIFGKGNGAAKKAAVVQAFQGAVGAYDAGLSVAQGAGVGMKLPTISNDAITAMSELVDSIVKFYNVTGIFQHSPGATK